jgi:hypothetical protein
MKKVKKIIITLLILLPALSLSAQSYKVTAPTGNNAMLVLKGFSGNMPIEGYAGSEIEITTEAEKVTPPERAKGLKAIYPAGTDNTGLGISVDKNGNVTTITCLIPFTRRSEYSFRIPENISVSIESGCENNNVISINGLKKEINIKNCKDITLKDVSGPLVLSTISGNVTITSNELAAGKPFSITSVSGDIDLTLPLKAAMNVDLNTVNGGVYTDFDIAETKDNMKRVGGNQISFALNGGGSKLAISTVSGNIYLRKGK